MTAMGNTPGPWRYDVQNHQIRTGEPTDRRFSGELIGTVSPLNPEMLYNGRLMASAPAMLNELEYAVRRLEGVDGFGCPQDIIDSMRAVIQEATGVDMSLTDIRAEKH